MPFIIIFFFYKKVRVDTELLHTDFSVLIKSDIYYVCSYVIVSKDLEFCPPIVLLMRLVMYCQASKEQWLKGNKKTGDLSSICGQLNHVLTNLNRLETVIDKEGYSRRMTQITELLNLLEKGIKQNQKQNACQKSFIMM